MGLFKLGFVAVYLSDPIISGFTTGAAILVFTSQVKHILGLTIPRYSGAFAVVKVCRYFIQACILYEAFEGVVCCHLSLDYDCLSPVWLGTNVNVVKKTKRNLK